VNLLLNFSELIKTQIKEANENQSDQSISDSEIDILNEMEDEI
jgi:hypothetical protein